MNKTAIKLNVRSYNQFREGDYKDETRYFISKEAAELEVHGDRYGKLGAAEAYANYFNGAVHSCGNMVWVNGSDGKMKISWTFEEITLEGC